MPQISGDLERIAEITTVIMGITLQVNILMLNLLSNQRGIVNKECNFL
ncbi:MAG: hypothetical protein ACFC03_02545 [Candidatus Malihini olakiniferum]